MKARKKMCIRDSINIGRRNTAERIGSRIYNSENRKPAESNFKGEGGTCLMEKYDLQFNQSAGRDFGIIMYDYPEIEQAKHNYNTYSIPGRDGELVSSDDHLSNITVKCTFSILSKRLIPKMREIKRWLSGTGRLK